MQRAVLKNHLNWLNSQKSYSDYCECLISKICPLIRLMRQDLVDQWVSEKDNFVIDHEQLECRVSNEVKDIYTCIKTSCACSSLIKEMCESFEGVLRNEDEAWFETLNSDEVGVALKCKVAYVFPPKHETMFERISSLVNAFVEVGKEDLVKDYIRSYVESKEYVQRTGDAKSYQCDSCFKRFVLSSDSSLQGILQSACPICGELLSEVFTNEIVTVRHVGSYDQDRFVPSYFKLRDLEDRFWASPAGAWEQLSAINWFWANKNRDYFRKDLHYTDEQECLRAKRLLDLHNARYDVQKIKKKSSNNSRIREREKVEQWLGVIVTALYPDINAAQIPDAYGPEELELAFFKDRKQNNADDPLKLALKVKWADGINEVCLLHIFQYGEKTRCNFFHNIIDQPGEFISLNQPCGDARKYLREANIDGVMADLFLKEANKAGAALKNNKVLLHDRSISEIKKVRKVVQSLKPIDWY